MEYTCAFQDTSNAKNWQKKKNYDEKKSSIIVSWHVIIHSINEYY